MLDLSAMREGIQRTLAERHLSWFIKSAWPIMDPSEFVSGWHIDAICEHLEAVYRREIRNLVINLPPRHMKSLAVSVSFPAWVWIHDPAERFLFSSYAHALAIRDSVKTRRVVESPWYKKNWGDRFQLTSDQNTKTRFENDKGGYRLATSVDGANTGEGGTFIVVDDPHNVREGESETTRQATISWWDEAMSSRFCDPQRDCKIIVQQRVHEEDLSGHLLTKETGDWVFLILPARHEIDRRCSTPIWDDPRTEDGELLWPERFREKDILELEEALGEYAAAGQLQQRPAPRTGGMFRPDSMPVVMEPESPPVEMVRFWDKAGTSGGGCYTAGVKLAKMKSGRYIVLDVVRGQWAVHERERIIKETTEADGKECTVYIEQEPGAAGKESVQASIRNLAGFTAYADRPTGDKETRAEPLAAQVNVGNVDLLKGPWNKPFKDELRMFGAASKYKDQVDAASGAFNKVAEGFKKAGVWGTGALGKRSLRKFAV